MTRKRPGAKKKGATKVLVHPELHTLLKIRAIKEASTLQDVVHAALCHETGRLDLLPQEQQASVSH